MSINKAIENIFEGKLDEMRQNFSAAITSKAVEKLEERKIQIAESYFGQVDESDLPITKKKEKVYRYKHKKSGKEISAAKDPGKEWEKMDEEEQLDEKTIASKKAKKGTKYKVQANDSDREGSKITFRHGKRVKDEGDYDRIARAFFMKKGTYGSAEDILKTVKE